MADWSSEKTLDFIEEYRKYTVLWRSVDKNYKNREERWSAFQELGEKYSLDSKSILNKIKSLRSYFHWEHSKVLKKKNGSSADEIYRSSWFAYKHMLFILQGDETREGKDTITTLEVLCPNSPNLLSLTVCTRHHRFTTLAHSSSLCHSHSDAPGRLPRNSLVSIPIRLPIHR